MAVKYARSTDGNNADDGSTWALAKADATGGLAVLAAGDRLWLSQSHEESTAAAITLTSPGTDASPCEILCGNDAAEPPTALATTATITTTGASNITLVGIWYCYGVTFTCGTSGTRTIAFYNIATAGGGLFEQCSFGFGAGAGTISNITVGSLNTNARSRLVEWRNCNIAMSSAGQYIRAYSPFFWSGGSIGGTVPTALFKTSASGVLETVIVRGVDLSALGSGKSLVDVTGDVSQEYLFDRCKLGASVAMTTGTNSGDVIVRIVNCDSADTNYRYQKQHGNRGDIYHETTIVRTGGASDGTTTISRKMVSTANTRLYRPLCSDWMTIWNDTTGSAKTATIEIVNDGVTLTDAEIWIEVDYLGTSGFPISSRVMDRSADILAAGANQTTSSETWTTTGLTTPVKQALAVSFTPQEKGPVMVRVCLARASTTVYFDPKITIS